MQQPQLIQGISDFTKPYAAFMTSETDRDGELAWKRKDEKYNCLIQFPLSEAALPANPRMIVAFSKRPLSCLKFGVALMHILLFPDQG